MSKLRWTSDAIAQLTNIIKHIQRDNPEAALKVIQGIYASAKRLETFPNVGRTGEREGTREMVHAPYVIVYRLKDDVAEILAIWDGSQDWR